jgi:transposase InsO family protein
MSRQNYHARRRHRERELVDTAFVVEWVKQERRLQPRLGARKLYRMFCAQRKEHSVKIGRDRFFKCLRENGLLLERLPSRPKTTHSRHSLPVFHNLVANMKPTGPNQAWASDLTYIRTDEGFLYAALITDMFSRKIVGNFLGDSLEAEGCLSALEVALKDLPVGARPIHHSDRGSQYCCHLYVKRLQDAGLAISMTEVLHCYENAMAERVNGILKQEYGLGICFRTKEQARAAFAQAVWLYNHRRPHLSLGYLIPSEVHRQAA